MKVREAIKLIESDGWRLGRTRGSHRHYHHPSKPGIVTIAGPGPQDSRVYNQTSGAEEMKYTVLYTPTATGYSAHVPDLPGCVGAAATLEETKSLMREAIEGHLECLREFGYAVPEAITVAEELEIPA